MKTNYLTKPKIIIPLVIGFILLLVGSFFDYQIDLNLYNPNSIFAIILAAFGMSTYGLLLCFAGLGFFRLMTKYNKFLMILLFIVCELGAFYITYHDARYYFSNIGFLLIIICILVVIVFDIICFPIVGKADTSKLMRYCMFLFVFALISLGIINGLKVLVSRPRFLYLVQNSEVSFKNWYDFNGNSEVKNYWLAQGVDKDMFKSFPSGHVQCGTALFFISSIGVVNKKFRNKHVVNILFMVASIYVVILGLSRLIIGAHFLSDISSSFIICFGLYCILFKLFGFEKSNKEVKA